MSDQNQNAAVQIRTQLGVSTTYTLHMPIKQADGSDLTVIKLRRPTAREMRSMSITTKFTMGQMLDLVGVIAGLSSDEVDLIDGADVLNIMEIFTPFLDSGAGKKE